MTPGLDLLAEVRSQIDQHGMLPSGGLAVAAVSGGADSVALLLALEGLGCRPVVAHLDHGLRPDSAADAEFVRDLARRRGLVCVSERRDVNAYRRQRKLSLETAAREVRHAFLRDVAQREGAGAIFLAHTADDQIETLLLRLIRGAGQAGLSGMRAHDGLLCRPMLRLWRTDVEAFLHSRQQPWREDTANRDPRFLRNRVRHELLPLLTSMNPGIRKVLLREAALLAGHQSDMDAEVLRRLGLSARHIEIARSGKAVTLPGGWQLTAAAHRTLPQAFDLELAVPGHTDVPGIGCITAELAAPRLNAGGLVEFADAGCIGGGLRVRSRRRGDRFVPLGMEHPKKLQDFFVDAHIARDRRDRVPLVTAGEAIVWVAGMRLDDRFKITAATKQALRLELRPQLAAT